LTFAGIDAREMPTELLEGIYAAFLQAQHHRRGGRYQGVLDSIRELLIARRAHEAEQYLQAQRARQNRQTRASTR
jgi:hypothetical protein